MNKKHLAITLVLLIIGLVLFSPKHYTKTIENEFKADSNSCKTDIIWSQLGLHCASGNGFDGNSEGTINFDSDLKVKNVKAYNLSNSEMKKLKGQYLLWALYNYMKASDSQGGFNMLDNSETVGLKRLGITLSDTEKLTYLNNIKSNIETYFGVNFDDSKYDTLEGISKLFLQRSSWNATTNSSTNYGLGEFDRRIIAYDAILYQLDPSKFANILDYNYDSEGTRIYYATLTNNLKSESLNNLIAMWDRNYAYTYNSINKSMTIPLHSTKYSFTNNDQVHIDMTNNSLLPTITKLTESEFIDGYYESVTFKHNLTISYKYNSNDIYLDFVTGDYFIDWAANENVIGTVSGTTQKVCPFGKWNSSVYFVPLEITYACSEGTLVIKGVDEDGNIINGKQFKVTGKNYDQIFTQTDKEVTVTLPYGDYIVTEITAPNGYILDDTEHNITINSTDSQTVKFINKHKSVTSPDTGTTITMFVIAGLLIICSGTSLIIYSKRKKANEI